MTPSSSGSLPATPLALVPAALRVLDQRRKLLLALAGVYLIWSSTYLAMRYAVAGLPPLLMGGVRFITAGVVLLAILRARGLPLPPRRVWLWSLPAGALLFLVGNGFVALAERKLSSGLAAVVCATMPLWAAALGLFTGARASRRELVGMLLGLGGVALLGGGDLGAGGLEAVLLVLAPVGWALGSLLGRKLAGHGMMAAATQMLCGGVLLLLTGLVLGERAPASPSAAALGALAYLIVFGSLLGFSAYTYLLQHARPALAMSYAHVNPALAVVLGAALGEHVGPEAIAATGLIAAAVAVMVTRRRPALAPAQGSGAADSTHRVSAPEASRSAR